MVMQKYKWVIKPGWISVEGKWSWQLIFDWKTLEDADKSGFTGWYRWNLTRDQVRLGNFLFSELYVNSPVKDAWTITWKLGDIVYYKPKNLQ